MAPAELVQLAARIPPPEVAAHCIQYAGPDLIAASQLSEDELRELYTPPAESFVAGRGLDNQEMWRELAANNTEVLRWVTGGYSEYVRQESVPVIRQPNNKNTGGEHHEFVTESVRELVAVGAVREVTDCVDDAGTVHVIAPLTVAVQACGKKRLCWNGRPVNRYMPQPSFKMEHADKAARMMRKGDFMFTIDMKSGYHQFPCKLYFKQFLCFEWEGVQKAGFTSGRSCRLDCPQPRGRTVSWHDAYWSVGGCRGLGAATTLTTSSSLLPHWRRLRGSGRWSWRT
jgi:hypothetical protein